MDLSRPDEQATRALAVAAVNARRHAYAPYSRYRVGAALLAADGALYTGGNVENASYGLSCCAERAVVFSAVSGGVRVIEAIAVATEDGGSPCGACRQVLAEFAPRDGRALTVLLVKQDGVIVEETTLSALLPNPFTVS